MAGLITKKLMKLPIGSHVEISCGDGTNYHEKITGIITDNDFTENVEITTDEGKEILLDYTIVRGIQVTKTIESVLKELTSGTVVRLSYGSEEHKEPDLVGTVGENDGEENIEIKTESGKEIILSYSIVRSILIQQTAKTPEVSEGRKQKFLESSRSTEQTTSQFLYQQDPNGVLNANDGELKVLFDSLPRDDKKKLTGAYDSFKYGIKCNDRNKIADAANLAKQILLREYEQGYNWASDAARFCGFLLRRSHIYDSKVFLVGRCFHEAALVAYRDNCYSLAASYAVLAMIEADNSTLDDLLIVLSASSVKSNDMSGLHVLHRRLPGVSDHNLKMLIKEAFANKGVQVSPSQMIEDSLRMLDTLYTNCEVEEEINRWLPEDSQEEIIQPTTLAQPNDLAYESGIISRLNWVDHTGVITGESGESYRFRYQDISNPDLKDAIEECMRSDLNGKVYVVKFLVAQGNAHEIQPGDSPVDRARAVIADTSYPNRFETAFELCKKALETPDVRRAIHDLVKHAITIYTANQDPAIIEEVLALYQQHSQSYPTNGFAVMDVAQCYGYLEKHSEMLEYADAAVSNPELTPRQKATLLARDMRICTECYKKSGDISLQKRILNRVGEWESLYKTEFTNDQQSQHIYWQTIIPYRFVAECSLDMLEEAKADFEKLSESVIQRDSLDTLMQQTLTRLEPECATKSNVEEDYNVVVDYSESVEAWNTNESYLDADEGEETYEEDPAPYEDKDGWGALKTTKEEVIGYALQIPGADRIPAILAYLRAGSILNPSISPVYRMVALASNDPMEAPNYDLSTLVNALSESNPAYAQLNDYCMAAAFLRASFQSGRGYDYSARGLRDSIITAQNMESLRNVYDTLEEFRAATGRSVDIYADYRNQDSKKLKEDLASLSRYADELYTKFVATAPREGVKFARLLETKKIVFDRDGYLATMLRHVMEQNHAALEREKDAFVDAYLNGTPRFFDRRISEHVLDKIISAGWELAGKNMQLKKVGATLQGDRRNNLRSNISDILEAICRWYALSEQGADLAWRTQEGEKNYLAIKPRLIGQLENLRSACDAVLSTETDPERQTGMFLLAATARELIGHLDGSWTFGKEKYTYVDFLRSDCIMLNEDFMPELTSTFCALPEFNILARIRRHVEEPKLGSQEHINQIYGIDKSCNNYGTAQKIAEYLQSIGESDSVSLPNQAEQFVAQTELQVSMRLRSFRETYALAMNYGQIMQSDDFCYTLEDTVRYWYAICTGTKNYGFFTSILHQAENQIHASARQYEGQLDEQLDALIASNRQQFDEHPGYAEAIRSQISQQNFIVAEDWMHRIRLGDFSLDVQQPEALAYLERFWTNYATTYKTVADTSRTLSSLIGRRDVHNKDTKRAQQLIDNWLSNGNPANSVRISQLLNLLGWQNIRVESYRLASEPKAELYYVKEEISTAGAAVPLHPIAAFGSKIAQDGLYVACLYGTYDCDRLYERIRALDALDGNKIILLDYALGGTDRRALARKLKKKESGLRNVYLIIDRVLICHLSNNYNENLINRILMAIAMPFSYCQPYVVESSHTMPPEIFIGRKDELLKIEQPDGVNLIYGGRQLGKSALFKKARADIDGNQNRRAILIDIKDCSCSAVARRLSSELIDLGILPETEVTENWETLCRNIKQRLRREDEPIRYLLVMLDEADAFIDDCARVGYRPLVELKDVQQALPGQFKFVLAGLHNIVRFNREVALGKNSVITHLPSLKITPFRTPEAQELLTVPLSYLGFSLPSKVTVSQILATVNYFPGLIQLYCQKLIESIRAADYAGYDMKKTPPYVVTDDHLRRVMADREFVDQIHEKFEITLRLDQDQGSYYYPITLLIGWMYSVDPSKNGYAAKDVLYHAKDLAIDSLTDLNEEKIDALLQELRDLNILRNVSGSTYLLASKNFRDLLGTDEEIFEKLSKLGESTV